MGSAMEKLEKYLLERGNQAETDTRLLREVAYDRLQDAIKHASLEPGEPLSETRISKALGISRTPVREALQQLAQEGLVNIIPGRAVTVAAPSIQEVLEAVHVRELLEPELVRLAAESLSAGAREIIKAALQEMEQAAQMGDRSAWSKADTTFHEALSHFCPNRLLGLLVLQARNRVQHTAIAEQTTDPRIAEYTQEHKAVIEAILTHDARTAERLTREHIRQLRQSMFKRLTRH
jgi:GntR family transcriptional regulator, rspAB operon transcriptional repressor